VYGKKGLEKEASTQKDVTQPRGVHSFTGGRKGGDNRQDRLAPAQTFDWWGEKPGGNQKKTLGTDQQDTLTKKTGDLCAGKARGKEKKIGNRESNSKEGGEAGNASACP